MHGIHSSVYTWPKALKGTPDFRTLRKVHQGCGNAHFWELWESVSWIECANGYREGRASLLGRKWMPKMKYKQEIHGKAGAGALWFAASLTGRHKALSWLPTVIYVHSCVNELWTHVGILGRELKTFYKGRIEDNSQEVSKWWIFSKEQLKKEFRCYHVPNLGMGRKLHSWKNVLGAPSSYKLTTLPTHETFFSPHLPSCPETQENVFIFIIM